ncbi:DUF4198 domain-containing protein [Polymorphobacter sp. PAMC 29334]|uniref:DUF4198 domain-containing protein n=1 Tax=Polymorphobacter sp. PAMC 29334 TaxID=2862331 RepID=UPI001C66FAAC|nr:DUF4198 domain-containing protein [Polymorphobacter sp. PAMC 29334]QYE34982.1 DUF4198 domain-containing protein [Polymorphobacter sp. PAMC 29334]
MRKLAFLLAALGSAATLDAHDFWVQPQIFAAEVNAIVPVTIEVGHGPFRQRWSAALDRITKFAAVGPAGTVDRRADLKRPDGGPSDADMRFAAPGTYVIVLETTRAESVLPGIRFTDYITAEGIAPAVDLRARNKTTDTPGRELYSRRAKALVRVGTSTAPQPQVTRPVGMTLEIVPIRDPYALGSDMTLPVQILYDGHPLAGAFVKLNNLDFDARPVETHKTDAKGQATFTIPFRGLWQMNVVWTKPIAGNPKADFDTVFSSLTFGYPRPGATPGRG